MIWLRSFLVLALAAMLAGCAIDKAPTQPSRPIPDSSSQPAPAAPAAPAAPEVAEDSPKRVEEGFAAVENVPQEQNWTPIDKFLALLKDHTQTPAHPLEAGDRNLNPQQRKLWGLASAARFQNEQDLYMYLVDNELLIYAKDVQGRGIFHWLAEADRIAIVRTLLKNKINHGVNEFDATKRQPLHSVHSIEMARTLIAAGNISSNEDEHGENVLVAMINRDEQAAVAIVADDICTKHKGILSLFQDSPLNAGDKKQRRPLHLAALRANLIAMDAIFRCSEAKINVFDDEMRSPLHYAAAAGPGALASVYAILVRLTTTSRHEISAVEFVNERDKHGVSALDIARRCGHTRVEKLLMSYGARLDPEAEDHEAPECPRDLLFNSGKDNFLNLSRIAAHNG